MATQPNTPAITPIFQDLTVETSSGEGRAIALHWTGTSMMYLVVSSTDASPPRWVQDSEINVAYIGKRPGSGGEPLVAHA